MQDENMTTSANPNTDSAQSVKPIPTSNTIADPIARSKSPIQSNGGNTSGQGSSAVVPEEVKGWSWGWLLLYLDLVGIIQWVVVTFGSDNTPAVYKCNFGCKGSRTCLAKQALGICRAI